MRSFDFIMIGATLLILSTAGCGQTTPPTCSRTIGVYTGRYQFIGGTCEATLKGRPLIFKQDDQSNTVTQMGSLSDVVTTEINFIGCTIGMKQDITDTGRQKMISSIRGQLSVGEDDSLSGEVFRTEYMPDGSTIRCMGAYNAVYTRDGGTLGSAAEHALGSH